MISPQQDQPTQLDEEKRLKELELEKERKRRRKYKVSNKYDPYLLKSSIDDCISDTLNQKYSAKEIHTHTNRKILLSIIITLFVAIAQFYPLDFPQNYSLLVGCCIAYFLLSTMYSIYEEKVVNKVFFEALSSSEEKKGEEKLIRTSWASDLKLYSDQYELQCKVMNKDDDKQTLMNIQKTLYVGNYFNSNGDIDVEKIEELIRQILKEAKKKTKVDS